MMTIESSAALFLDDAGTLSVAQLVERSGLTETELQALIDCGALEPRDAANATWTFSMRAVVTARTARRLRDDFALDDAHALAVVLRFVQRVESLERQLRDLEGRASGFRD